MFFYPDMFTIIDGHIKQGSGICPATPFVIKKFSKSALRLTETRKHFCGNFSKLFPHFSTCAAYVEDVKFASWNKRYLLISLVRLEFVIEVTIYIVINQSRLTKHNLNLSHDFTVKTHQVCPCKFEVSA